MVRTSERVLAYLADHAEGQDDDQIGEALHINRIQINAICRRLAEAGAIRRGRLTAGGKIINQSIAHQPHRESAAPLVPQSHTDASPAPHVTLAGPMVWLADSHAVRQFAYAGTAHLEEDQIKAAVKQALEADGWQVEVRFGHIWGIDIEAVRGDERFVLEAKGEGISDQVRGNYFDGALGELLRRMNAPGARYGLALPAHRRFTGLVERLPLWIRQRLNLWFFFVRPAEHGLEVGAYPPNGRGAPQLNAEVSPGAGH